MARSRLGAGKEQARSWLGYGWSMSKYFLVRQERTLSLKGADSLSEGSGLRLLRYAMMLVVILVMGGAMNEVWGATVTYHIINLGKLDDSGQLTSTRTEALQFTSTSLTVGVPNEFKSPLAKNWKYYSSNDVTYNSSTKECVLNSGPSLSVGDALSDGDNVYVTYELNEDEFSTVNLIDGGICKIKFDETDQYLQQTVYNNDPNTGSFALVENSTFYWKVNIKDPYQITIQSQSTTYPDWYLSADAGKFGDIRLRNPLGPEGTNGTAKKNKVWAFGLLPGGSVNTYRLIVTDGYTYNANKDGIDQFGHGYLNNCGIKNGERKSRYQTYNGTSHEKCDLTFVPLTKTYNIVNNSGGTLVQATTTNYSFDVPDVIKSPLASYTYYGTQQNAIDETSALSGPNVGSLTTIYVRYTTSGGSLDVNGGTDYYVITNGYYLYALNASEIGIESPVISTDNTRKWKITGNDAYQLTLQNADNNNYITYNVSSGEAVPTLSGTGGKFFLHQSSTGKYELVAATNNDFSATDYYTLGVANSTLTLYSKTNYPLGEDELQTEFSTHLELECAPPTLTYTHTDKTVSITSTYPTDATIYYTTNGDDPIESETATNFRYSGSAISTYGVNTIKAIAVKDGFTTSSVATINRVVAPIFGSFDDATQSVTISCITEGAAIYYTTDGTAPTTDSTPYSGAVTLTSGGTIKAIAVMDGYIYSNVVESNTFTQTAAPTIVFDQYTNTFTISAATGATIHYTIDGNPPTASSATYSSPVSLTSAATIKAFAAMSGEVYSTITSKAIGKSNTPVISFSGDDEITITTDPTDVEVRYTTDGTDPTNTSTQYSAPFTLTATQDVVKAIVYEADKVSSDVATLTVIVRLGSSHPYLIQSQENTNYYLQPCVMTEHNISNKTTTSSIARPIMQWYFTSAGTDNGKQYYFIANQNNLADQSVQATEYLYYHTLKDGGKDYFLISRAPASDFNSTDKFKFTISAAAAGGYNIIPKENEDRCINKNGGNVETWAAQASADKTNARSRWNFLPAGEYTLPFAPINVSTNTNSDAYYYTIGSGRADTYLVTGTDCVSSSTSTGEDRVWFVREAGNDGWNTYYHIINAETGKNLYLEKTTTWSTNSYTLKDASEVLPENAYRLEFLLPKSTTDSLYIVPKSLQDNSIQYYTGLALREDLDNPQTIPLRKGAVRQILWNFTTTTFKCADPVVTYENDKIVIRSPQGADVYYTIDGANNEVIPSSSTHYTQPLTIGSSPQTIRAVCARRADGADNSDVVTIIFNPTISLNTGATLPYDGLSHQPTISSAEFNSTIITDECTIAKYLDANGNEVTSCKDAGEYTVVITDADGGDYYVYGTTTFTITKASLTITPNDGQSKEYGDPDPELTYTASGLIEGDGLTGSLSYEGESVGTHNITQGTLNNTNYDINFTTGKTFEITPKSLGSGSTPAPNITCDVTETDGTYNVVVKHGESNLTLNSDYTKSSESDGTKYYEVTVTGANNYTGSISVKLAKIQLSKLTDSTTPGGAALFVSNSGDGNFVVPDNMTAYIVTGINGNTLVTETLDNIPDNVPVLLVSGIDANSFRVQTTSSGTTPTGTNLLVEATGNDAARTFGTAEIYILYNGEFVLNAEGTLAAGKVYLPKSAVAGSRPVYARLFINWGETTVIENAHISTPNPEFSDQWYTLDGQKLTNRPTKKGLYLRNREKIVIR